MKIEIYSPEIQEVKSFLDLISTPFEGKNNAICWSRNLVGNFAEIVDNAELDENMMELDEEMLHAMNLSKEGQLAREILINDLNLLKAHGASPVLNAIKFYERDDSFPFFPTDVYSYHVDRSPLPTATFLCTYHGASSDILPNSHAKQKVVIPEIREELRKLYTGPNEGFEDFLTENFFDLHYQAQPNARPINLGKGHLWKLAVDHPESKVLPCVHRAPIENEGESRLLLIC
jgi:hypothetical protein